MIKAEIYFDGEYYCARCLNIDVFTQGKTIDEVVNNLKEAVSLHLEDENLPETSILTMMELGPLKPNVQIPQPITNAAI
ncbi:MAG: toxin-antitoxin system, antitoxin component, HicB family protein [Candidatus Altiarchaeales archaeon A3]|nr:MAG: toxin-antitoxin system, antitoxin component, HicB family protein [Candidatus Altiarchaeales archaeon A3]